ncbi:MAG: UvrB/UvrC motif-containing protein [Phycisphaerales bacterium]|nr:UvrB/UvrC motif-containing protein [Phycisphaerales bacterium]
MKCDQCDNEATVHELVVKNGKRLERHLCEGCAKGQGLPIPANTPITQLLTQFITSQVQPTGVASASQQPRPAAQPTNNACPECGLAFAQFRQSGLLGCPACYAAFEGQLSPLLARAHDRGTHHKGKLPRRLREVSGTSVPPPVKPVRPAPASRAAAAEIVARVKELRERLTQAIAAEQYEIAAQLRDELIGIEKAAGAPKAARKTAPARASRAAKPAPPQPPPPRNPETEGP